jgi:hypothetical protein
LIDAPIFLRLAFLLFVPFFVDTSIFQFVTEYEQYAVVDSGRSSSSSTEQDDDDDSSFGSLSTPSKSPTAISQLRHKNSRFDPSPSEVLRWLSP